MLNSKQEEGNALTAVGDEIRSRSAAAKKEAAKTEQVDKKVKRVQKIEEDAVKAVAEASKVVAGFQTFSQRLDWAIKS